MPTPDTALVYPGTCLFEGTNLSEGRGTTRPFELIGAPTSTSAGRPRCAAWRLPACTSGRPTSRRPSPSSRARRLGGVQLHVPTRATFDPVRTGVR